MVMRSVLTLSLLALVFIAPSLCAAVSANLSSSDIDELESVRLVVRVSETRETETLDLSALEKDFHVLQTNTSSQYRFINGREQSWVDYQITLQPKNVGRLTIPSIQIGHERTPTLSLRVRALSEDTRRVIDSKVFFENELSSRRVYVQAELILVRRLLYADGVQLYSDLPGAPELADAVVLTLGETRSGTTEQDGQIYGVVEQRYAIYPETSGTLTIPGIDVTASVRLVENGRVSRKGVRIGTDDVSIEVMGVPESYPAGAAWLPAREVQIIRELTAPDAIQVGDTLTHELLVHMTGNVGSKAPPVELELDPQAFRVYPQSPVINDDTAGEQVTGARLQTLSLVPLIPGDLDLPAQHLYWWNTDKDALAVARVPAQQLQVFGTPVAPSTASEAEVQTTTPTQAEPLPALTSKLPSWSRIWPYALALIALIGVLLLVRRLIELLPGRRHTKENQFDLDRIDKSADASRLHAQLCQVLRRAGRSPQELGPHEPLYMKLSAAAFSPRAQDLNQDERTQLIQAVKTLLRRKQAARESTAPLPELYS